MKSPSPSKGKNLSQIKISLRSKNGLGSPLKTISSATDAYTDVDDFEDEEELEAEQEAIEKEHQDYLLLKVEETERKKKGQH